MRASSKGFQLAEQLEVEKYYSKIIKIQATFKAYWVRKYFKKKLKIVKNLSGEHVL